MSLPSSRSSRPARRPPVARWIELAALALLVYVPILLSSPGRISADTKQYLYLDPGRFMARAVHLWDPSIATGTVSHQQIGYLFPMGPWYWAFHALGVPTWVAQRLWLGTISFAAVLGARWLFRYLGLGRVAALSGALVYLLSPYQLAFSARTSVLLLPWAALPWLLGLADRAVRRAGWRDPALIALIVLVAGSVNASSLLLVGIGPLVWLVAAVRDRASFRAVAGVVARTGALGLGVCAWSIAGLRMEGAYALPVLQLTEDVRTVAATSTPLDVLRGLGNWYFYGRDPIGPSVDQAGAYLNNHALLAVTFGLAGLGLAAGILVRWVHRSRFVALLLVGVVVSVGAWPVDEGSPFARAVGQLSENAAVLALRNTARAVPLVVMGMAGLLAAAVDAWHPERRRVAAGALVGLLAVAGLGPVWTSGYLTKHMARGDIPSYWQEAADHLDASGSSTRVLVLPGAPFGAYRWGDVIDPLLPGLMDRPELARDIFPQGSASSVLLLDALDRRVQEGTIEPDAIAPVARLLGVGDIVLRSDLEYERFDTPNPRALWRTLSDPVPEGLAAPVSIGPTTANRASPRVPRIDGHELSVPAGTDEPPAVAIFGVEDPVSILRTAPVTGPILLAGDADGIVDAAAAGVVNGQSTVLQATSLRGSALDDALAAGAPVVITDTYRRRIQTWFYAIKDTRGPTERAGETIPEPSGYDYRIDPTPGVGDDQRTVVEPVGAVVTATGGGGAARPEDRAAAALDGDLSTSWRVGGADPTGNRLTVRLDQPRRVDHLTIVQPQDGPRDRVLTQIRVVVDGGAPITVDLGPASLTPTGQRVAIPATTAHRVDLELAATSAPPFDPALANAVGFAEVGLGVTVDEQVRVPTGLLDQATGHTADVVLTRLRYDPYAVDRQDPERTLVRVLDVPLARSFGLGGTIRVDDAAADAVVDRFLGTDLGGATVTGSSRLLGDLAARGSRAMDGDPATAWQTGVGAASTAALRWTWPSARGLGDVVVKVVDDGRHSVPTGLRLVADGHAGPTVAVTGPAAGGIVTVTLPAPAGPAADVHLEVTGIAARTAVPGDPDPTAVLPVAITEVTGAGVPTAVDAASAETPCLPLVQVDGRPVEVRATGTADHLDDGLALEPCGGPLALAPGDHVIRGVDGRTTGLDVDRLVLSSAADGGATTIAPRGDPRSAAGSTVTDVADHRDRVDATVTSDGQPFLLVLGESDNAGWRLHVDGAEVGDPQIVDGYANGWVVTPHEAGELGLRLEWVPQRQVWAALLVSALATVLCLAIVWRARRRDEILPPHRAPVLGVARPRAPLGWRALLATAVVVGALALLTASPEAAVAGSASVLLLGRLRWAPLGLAAAAALVIPAARVLERPSMAWLGLAVLLAAAAVDAVATRREGSPSG